MRADFRGIVEVYTGEGKGKTTAAWGLAMRAVGQGLRSAVVQFMKPATSGERTAAARLAPELSVFGETSPYRVCADQRHSEKCREESRAIFRTAREIVLSGEWDLVVLDEINVVLFYGFVSRQEMEELLSRRPPHTELVLTGRGAPDWLKDAAELVTEMLPIKHPLEQGITARRGIEF